MNVVHALTTKGLASLQGLIRPVDCRTWVGPKEVLYWWGPTGCGKTRAAHELGHCYEPIRAGKGTIWWDGYAGEEIVLFDDIRSDDVRLSDVLRWTDGRNFVAQVKGGTVAVTAKTFVFTSNDPAHLIWMGVDLAPLDRRLKNDRHVSFDKIKKPRVEVDLTPHGVGPGNTLQVQPVSPELIEVQEEPQVYLEDYLIRHGINISGFE